MAAAAPSAILRHSGSEVDMPHASPSPRRVALIVAVVVAMMSAGLTAPASTAEAPPWEGTSRRLPATLRDRMRGVSWHSGCPVGLRDLRLLRVRYWGFDGEAHRGRMVVYERQDRKVLRVLRRLYEARFPIRRMRLIEAYGGSDAKSMEANNTSAFNCRRVAGTTRWSEHAYGRAIDINPVQNPYVRGSVVEPPAGRKYLDRSNVRKGMVVRPGPVVRAFAAVDWKWGGDWQSSKDYQHFSRTGR
ncbi:MAG: M15 family peptidase [Nitriliruptorales bacterium]|nr:M15 family peptidase [Nitriliruptorales bacterium]